MRKSKLSITTPLIKDENQANILCDVYWEAPFDTNVCRRKLLTVQKTREKQQQASKGAVMQGRITPTRSPSASSHDNGACQLDNVHHQNGPIRSEKQHGLSFLLANQGSGVHSSSMYTDHFQGGLSARSVTDTSSVVSAGQHTYTSGPMSYNDAGYSTGFLQNSFAEVDFACAIQRPGVVPMGDESVASSIDMHALRRSQQQQQYAPASFGGNYRNHLPSGVGNHSFGETSENFARRHALGSNTGSVGAGPVGIGYHLSSSMQLPDALWQQAPGAVKQHHTSAVNQHHTSSLLQMQQGAASSLQSFGHHPILMQPVDDPRMQAQFQQQDPTSFTNNPQQQMAYDHAQVYLQQQHLALQQQQMMLQQQQAALALQQQQLQAYGVAPSMVAGGGQPSGGVQGGPIVPNGAAGQHASVGMSQNGNGGYYFVTATDGTQMMFSAGSLPYQQGAMDPRYYQDPSLYQQG